MQNIVENTTVVALWEEIEEEFVEDESQTDDENTDVSTDRGEEKDKNAVRYVLIGVGVAVVLAGLIFAIKRKK